VHAFSFFFSCPLSFHIHFFADYVFTFMDFVQRKVVLSSNLKPNFG
jgi:hypothetical protein